MEHRCVQTALLDILHTKFWSKYLKGRDYLEDYSLDGRIKRFLKKQDRKLWTGFICLRIGTVGNSCEHGNEPSGSVKVGTFLDDN
jgi:hypothetical protein